MATDENPYARFVTAPTVAAIADENPYAKFIAAPAAPTPESIRAFGDAIPAPSGDGSPTYDPDIERAKKGPTLADDLRALRDATIRPAVHAAADLPLMPINAATGVANFIRQGDFSKEAFLRGANPFAQGSPTDYQSPSQRLDTFLDAHTQAPSGIPGKVAEAISSGVLGARLPGMPAPAPRPAINPTRGDLAVIAGERHNVPVQFDDWTTSPFAKKVGVAAENIPVVGTAGGREAQAIAAQAAAERLAGRFTADLTGDAIPPLVQSGLQRRLSALRGSARQLYARAAQQLDPAGDVPRPRFDSAINAELARQERLGTAANPRVVEILSKYDHAPGGNFSLMRDLRSQIGEEISDFYSGGANKAIGAKGVERLREMRDTLEADMADFAHGVGGGAEAAWRNADSFYRTNLVPFKQQGFADLVRTGEPEKAWSYLMTEGGKPSRAVRMYNGLDPMGRAAVRGGMLQEAVQEAITPKGTFSPAKFAKYMEDRENVVNQFFHGSELEEVRGFTNLMRHVERAGQYMENPPTGNRLIGPLMVGSAAVAPKALALGAGVAGSVKLLFQTKAGRDLLISASRLKPGGPAMREITAQIPRIATRAAASGAAQAQEEDANAETAAQ